MRLAVRITGWVLFGAGMATFMLGGGFDGVKTSVLPWIGLGFVILGCLVTALSTFFSSIRYVRGGERERDSD